MWAKAVAGGLILLGAQGFGYALCQEMQCIIYHCTEQKRMLLYISSEISFLHRPIQEILETIQEKVGEPYRSFCGRVAQRLEDSTGQSLYHIWEDEAVRLERKRSYPAEAMQYLRRIGHCLGCEEQEVQLSALALVEQEINRDLQKAQKEKEDKSRLIRTLSLLAGVFVIVLFL